MTTQTTEPSARSIGQLLASLEDQVRRLFRAEIDLAKAELTGRAKELGVGAGLFGGAAFLALYGFGALVATGIIALAVVWPAWLAALAVTLLLFALAGVLVLVGRAKVSKGAPPKPEAAVESIKDDVETVKRGLKP